MAEEPRESQEYLSYLMRLWRAADEHGKPVWHATLEAPVTREMHTFADLMSLFAFLRGQTDGVLGRDGKQEAESSERSALNNSQNWEGSNVNH
jgi:hypothetical protein